PPQRKEKRVGMALKTGGGMARGMDWDCRSEQVAGVPFAARGPAGDTWRDLEITVTPAGVDGRWGEQVVGHVRADDVSSTFGRWLTDVSEKHPDAVWANADPAYAPRGGIGLLVTRGTASFRSAVLTPLSGSH